MVESVPGQQQIADVGTKAMLTPRLGELKKMMSMGSYEAEEKVEEKKVEKESEERKSKEENAVRSQKDGRSSEDSQGDCGAGMCAPGEGTRRRSSGKDWRMGVCGDGSFALIGMMRIL